MTQVPKGAPFIDIREMNKSFRVGADTIPIFSNLNMTIEQGEFLALMGPSGSGKSTLLNILAGIDKPDSGKVRIGDANLDQMGENAKTQWRAHNVGIVFQFYNLMPMLNVADNVGLPLLLKPLGRKQRKDRIDRFLDLVGLTGRQKQMPGTMSGGQQQRVGIARALVTDPTVLLCDEPTGDLDRTSADEVLRILCLLNREMKKTIIMVTHDPEAAAQASRVLHLNKGSFVAQPEGVPA